MNNTTVSNMFEMASQYKFRYPYKGISVTRVISMIFSRSGYRRSPKSLKHIGKSGQRICSMLLENFINSEGESLCYFGVS